MKKIIPFTLCSTVFLFSNTHASDCVIHEKLIGNNEYSITFDTDKMACLNEFIQSKLLTSNSYLDEYIKKVIDDKITLKADKADVNKQLETINNDLNTKATQSDIDATIKSNTQSTKNQLDIINQTLSTKADDKQVTSALEDKVGKDLFDSSIKNVSDLTSSNKAELATKTQQTDIENTLASIPGMVTLKYTGVCGTPGHEVYTATLSSLNNNQDYNNSFYSANRANPNGDDNNRGHSFFFLGKSNGDNGIPQGITITVGGDYNLIDRVNRQITIRKMADGMSSIWDNHGGLYPNVASTGSFSICRDKTTCINTFGTTWDEMWKDSATQYTSNFTVTHRVSTAIGKNFYPFGYFEVHCNP